MKRTTIEIIAGLIFATVILFFYFSAEADRDRIELKNVELSTLKDSVTMTETKNGELVAKVSSVEIEKENLKKSMEIAGFDIKELRDQNIEWRKVTNALRVELQAAGSAQTEVTDTFYVKIDVPGKIDTVWYSVLDDWSNDYLSIYNGKIVEKRLDFDYNYKVGMDIIQSHKRKSTIVTISLTDPYARITTANSITVENKTKWYRKWWAWGAIGFVGGVFIAK